MKLRPEEWAVLACGEDVSTLSDIGPFALQGEGNVVRSLITA